jgi:drug/metabolite transporter (DMT)-like permease
MSPAMLVASRIGLAALAVTAVLAFQRRMPPLGRSLLAATVVYALLDSVLPYTFIAWAEQSIDSGMAAVLMSTMPLFTAVFAAATLPDERLSFVKLAGLGAGFVGVVVLAGPDALDVRQGVGSGHLGVVAGAMCYGAAAVWGKRLLRTSGADVLELTALKLIVATVIALPIAFALEGAPDGMSLSTKGIAVLLMLGVVSTGLSRVLYLWTVGSVGSVGASLVTYIIPVSGLTLGWAVLGEQITLTTLAGMGLIIGGVATVMYGQAAFRLVARRGVAVDAPAPVRQAEAA